MTLTTDEALRTRRLDEHRQAFADYRALLARAEQPDEGDTDKLDAACRKLGVSMGGLAEDRHALAEARRFERLRADEAAALAKAKREHHGATRACTDQIAKLEGELAKAKERLADLRRQSTPLAERERKLPAYDQRLADLRALGWRALGLPKPMPDQLDDSWLADRPPQVAYDPARDPGGKLRLALYEAGYQADAEAGTWSLANL